MNGIKSSGGSGTDGVISGGVATVTQPMFMVIAIATPDAGWASRNAEPPTTFPVWPTKRPSGDLPVSNPSP